jgi:hypothetical protein
MKEKYADQDEEEREIKMALIGAKNVKGFDIVKHQQYKQGKAIFGKDEVTQPEVEEEEAPTEEVTEEAEVKEQPSAATAEGDVEETKEEPEEGAEEEVKADDGDGDDGDDFDEEAEIAKIMKEEDINVLENTDVSEIDKLTGAPKTEGNYSLCFS